MSFRQSLSEALRPSTPKVKTADIPIERYIEVSRKLDLTGVAWDDIPNHPMAPGALECLIYMMDVEGYTRGYLRDLLNTAAIEDHEVSRFMTLWAYEELFHQETLERFLGYFGRQFPRTRQKDLLANTAWHDRLMMHGAGLLSYASNDFIATYMTWGALNELTAGAAYELLAERCGHPVLTDLLSRIMKDERRHFSFYYHQAAKRLDNRTARVMASTVLRNFWHPVGHGVKTTAEMRHLTTYCFASPQGRARIQEIDGKIAALPGLAGFNLFETWLNDHLVWMSKTGKQVPETAIRSEQKSISLGGGDGLGQPKRVEREATAPIS